MATKKWRGGADAVIQVISGSIDTFDATTDYQVAIGNHTIEVDGTTDVGTTATLLVNAMNNSTHPYFVGITWANPSAGTITGTHDTAGVPFTATLAASGGTGTVTNFSTTTAATGPHHVGNTNNWEGGALPVATDDVIIDGGTSLLYELDALTSIALTTVDIRQTFIGVIGLEPSAYATSLDGQSLDPDSIKEYRDTHFELDCPLITIGEHFGPGSPAGSGRILIDQQSAAASRLVVVNTASSTPTSAPAVRYLASDADADVDVRFAPGGVGIASDAGDTSTVGEVLMSDRTASSSLFVGEGVTFTLVETFGGSAQVASATTAPTITNRGEMTISGEGYTITTMNIEGGECIDTHLNTAGDEWGTVNLRSGTLELPAVAEAASRTWATMNVSRGRLAGDMSRLSATITVNIEAGNNDNTAIDLSDL